ncbi:CoA-acylating methylmalonate-semialdehyde dehydrogenase [Verminephrobacter aporrectodeae]|uniref:Methylmalonate-semialdehyde dehydrogenase (CoA acylating) n=1 Tax=Verminephrobacter aporrectodeae subsp. tuberculatae TaxID=1110392 RepID=A0ABT3KYQ5_9BURK|nr:CoA-acylating methylmalonate-semialdehyde dehydrogenase [Verminephrobacter aporrectodeae]MCW5223579.1 methylmalonate-semialdehyde dehydrogenase (CoA acylating) [Verminephrobacter aporrectodeae subsp. tuberculatae]MCW5256259.1 methylmalonate-semialdehyde dehydrogenase (CoA acylating) [Verminephrobacter aporrectodeae subsp. tuberculatae]MCW5289044.1 methylmalonate-semialdehyde dehydrogenase (CoA acylating) [Verminephrobacter aporrectodeae subsp. tuberculatae]MCW5323381.1 methylmalonate-semiald
MKHDQSVTHTIGHLIDGRIVADAARTQPVFNPATGLSSSSVALADRATVEQAIASAQAAFPAWRNTPPLKRARVMSRLKGLLEENADKIAALITAEHGKVLSDAHGELQRGIENVEYASYAPELLKGEHSRNVGPSIDSWSEFQALGVTAGITPFNFPAMVPLWMWPMALVCGNTFVLKPSERDPSSVLFIAQLALQAGVPPGVLNVVNGDKEAVDTLLTDARVKAVSFVGSTPIAQSIYATGCAHGKRVQALGGAKNHAVLMPDADVNNAVSALMGAAYGSCGERCMAIPLLVAVGDAVGDAVVAGLKTEIAKMKVGPGTDNGNDMGPLVTKQHFEKVRAYVDSGVAEGAELVVDGRGVQVAPGHENGYFLGACLFDQVRPGMKIYQEEIFGPVLGVVRVKTLQEAMDLIDAHEYGNGTCIFTRDGEAARYFSDHIQVGMVGVNVPLPVPVAYHSFGGFKRSLFGDLNAYGPDAVRFYTKRKTITQRWPSAGVREGAVFSFPSNR